VIAAVALVVAAGWWFFRGRSTPAFTERDVILIADFQNTTGDAVFDDALKQAVAVQLQQTPFVTILPDQQILATLRLMQRRPDEPVHGAVARELCQRAGARATVEGSIAPLGSSYVIAVGVHDCGTGAPIAQEQTQADSKEGVLKALGSVVTKLRGGLGESLASIQKNDVPAEATTKSLEALRAYGLAVKTRITRGDEQAIPFLTQAIERDPDFALAHAKLGVVYSNVGRRDEARRATERAYELRDRVSEYERLYILWSYYARVQDDDAKERETLELLTTTYPRDFAARNNLGIYYMSRGEFADALAQFNAAAEIAPSEPLPPTNAAFALVSLGRYEEGMAMAERATRIRPARSLANLQWIQAHLHYDPREASFREAAEKITPPDAALQVAQSIALWDGRFRDYEADQLKLIQLARAAKKPDTVRTLEFSELILRAILQGGPYLDRLRQATLTPDATPGLREQGMGVLAIAGDIDSVRRELPRMERDVKPGTAPSEALIVVRAYVKAADGRVDEAVADLQGVIPADTRRWATYFNMGQIQERAGRKDAAIASYRKVVDAAPALGLNFTLSIARLSLGSLLAGKGDAAGAKVQFDILARQWEKADADFKPAVELKKLR
jgi:tetratricopeptide (TPR) repeat protein